jgi:hypothetical protein
MKRIARMVELGELREVTIGGVTMIPPSEQQRLMQLFEIEPVEAEPDQQASEFESNAQT